LAAAVIDYGTVANRLVSENFRNSFLLDALGSNQSLLKLLSYAPGSKFIALAEEARSW
jgi:hypothetical protein